MLDHQNSLAVVIASFTGRVSVDFRPGNRHLDLNHVQAKRTNVGIALITSPRVLFLDEPTSGESSCASAWLSLTVY